MATNKKRLLVPDVFGMAGLDILKRRDDIEVATFPGAISTPDFQALLKSLGEVNGVALGGTPFGAAERDAAKGLQVVARIGVGYDAVDVPALSEKKIPLMVAGTANSPSVAEHAIFLMMNLAKRAAHFHAMVQEGRWGADRMKHLPVDLLGKTLLIVGFGRIGTRTAKRALAMEMNVLVYDPYVKPDAIRAAGCEPVELEAALPRADFVTIHCPKTPETVGMFNAKRLALMKPSAILVSTARGGIIDERALHAALTGGKLAAAGLDVFEQEPTSKDNPLLNLPNFISSPHMAGVTVEAVMRMAETTAQNMLSVLDGRTNRDNVINKDVLG
ncbi:MAG: hydroxyacid dehydrogenase [Alphaproteobacteria bacterium]|nr:hydroxyacid dehydrogenase [Alphaproteobacteria bacterium]